MGSSHRDFAWVTGLLVLLLTACATAPVQPPSDPQYPPAGFDSQVRIVVVPSYTEDGRDLSTDQEVRLHYRRMMRFINNQLVRYGFEVINPVARDAGEREYNRILQRAREDSSLASVEMCRKYGTDVAYIVWLDVRLETTADQNCAAYALGEGEGYDSAGRDIGAGMSKTFMNAQRYCEDAVVNVEKELGDTVGRVLGGWRERVYGSAGSGGSAAGGGGVLHRSSQSLDSVLNVRLDGATEYESVEVFGKVINSMTGVVEVKQYALKIDPTSPQRSYSTWRVSLQGTDAFRFQANVMIAINRILDSGGRIQMKGVPYRYTAGEVNFLMGIRPNSATSREIQFIVDRERVRDREMSGTHDPYD